MLIKEAKYEEVQVTQKREVTPPIYGCDQCGKELPEYPNEDNRLAMSVYRETGSGVQSYYFHFCSWRCVLEYIPQVKCNHFVTLPYLLFDETSEKSASALIQILKDSGIAKA